MTGRSAPSMDSRRGVEAVPRASGVLRREDDTMVVEAESCILPDPVARFLRGVGRRFGKADRDPRRAAGQRAPLPFGGFDGEASRDEQRCPRRKGGGSRHEGVARRLASSSTAAEDHAGAFISHHSAGHGPNPARPTNPDHPATSFGKHTVLRDWRTRKQYHFWPGKQGFDAWDVWVSIASWK